MAQVAPRAPVEDPLLGELEGAARQSVPAFERAIHAVEQRDYRELWRSSPLDWRCRPAEPRGACELCPGPVLERRRRGAPSERPALAGQPPSPAGPLLPGPPRQGAGDPGGGQTLFRGPGPVDPRHSGARYYLANLELAAGRCARQRPATVWPEAAPEAPAPTALLWLVAEARAGAPGPGAAGLNALIAAIARGPQLGYALIRLLAAAQNARRRDPTGPGPGQCPGLRAARTPGPAGTGPGPGRRGGLGAAGGHPPGHRPGRRLAARGPASGLEQGTGRVSDRRLAAGPLARGRPAARPAAPGCGGT